MALATALFTVGDISIDSPAVRLDSFTVGDTRLGGGGVGDADADATRSEVGPRRNSE